MSLVIWMKMHVLLIYNTVYMVDTITGIMYGD